MSMEIWMTKAGIGDCILIRCGKQKKKVNILIDSRQGVFTEDWQGGGIFKGGFD